MKDKAFITFLQEIAEKDKLEVIFSVIEFMEWAGIPYEQLKYVLEDVNSKLHVLMNYKCTSEQMIMFVKERNFYRIIQGFRTFGTIITVEFSEWTKDVRGEKDWLIKIEEAMENNNEHN